MGFFAFLHSYDIIQCMKTVSVGPFRIPEEHKNGLLRLKADRPHITMSHLIREAIHLYLVKRGIIEVEEEWEL